MNPQALVLQMCVPALSACSALPNILTFLDIVHAPWADSAVLLLYSASALSPIINLVCISPYRR